LSAVLDAAAPPDTATLTCKLIPASALLKGVNLVYCVDAARGRRLLGRMAASGQIALDIETTPNKAEVDRLAELTQARAATVGKLKALRKLKAPADEIADLVAERNELGARIKIGERAGLDPRRSRIRLVQAYDGGREVLIIDIDRTGVAVLAALEGADVICHNAGFEMSFLEPAGVALGEVHCTLQAARLTLGERSTSLADVAAAYLNATLDKSQQASDWGALHLTREQLTYAALDAIVEWEVAQHVFVALRDQTPAYEIQVRAVPAAMRMQERGFKFDVDAHARLIAELKQERLAVEQEYRAACMNSGHAALAGKVPSTPAQKGDLLTALLTSGELMRWRRTEKSGALSTKRSELNRARRYPPIMALAKLSRIDKLLSSFGQALAVLTAPETGRIHASYSVASTASGRASCSRPNLQQVPQDQRFRALFIAEPGNVLICADYSSMELRAAAHIFDDSAMTSAFEQGLDLHNITAARMTGKDPAEVTTEERKGAKAVNFGAIYGQGPRGLMQAAWEKFELVLTQPEAEEWTRAFKDSYPGLVRGQQEHHERCQESLRIVIGKDAARGIGRIFPFSRLKEGDNGYTRSRNLPIQGACADASMLALTYADDRLFDAEIDGGPVAWLHDEIVVEVASENADRAAAILRQAMVDGFAETFPGAPLEGLVDLHIGMSWSEAKGSERQRKENTA
jgi:DNA polymerase-1